MKFLVLAGTSDGRLLAEELAQRGHEVLLSVLTAYGAELAGERLEAEKIRLKIRYGAFSVDQLAETLRREGFAALVDASHPYAKRLHETAKEAALLSGSPYFRYVRPSGIKGEEHVYWAKDITEAAELAAGFGDRILLTTGSKDLSDWLQQPDLAGKTVYVRVLPTSQVLSKCEALGLKPWQIIAAQGPFSQAWNEAMISQLRINVMVAKDSGAEGGTPEKILACKRLSIPLILLVRPDGGEPKLSLTEFMQEMEEKLWIPKSFS